MLSGNFIKQNLNKGLNLDLKVYWSSCILNKKIEGDENEKNQDCIRLRLLG